MCASSDDEDGVTITTVESGELRETDHRSTRLAVSRRIVVLGGVSGFKFGILSGSPSSYMSAPATGFAQMYTLTLIAGSGETDFESANKEHANTLTGLEVGDCGSWIVDEATNEVYGHVVASDIFGEVYVAPLKETLKQVEEVLRADSVSLPTRSEVATWIDVHTARAATDSRTLATKLDGGTFPHWFERNQDSTETSCDSAYGSSVPSPSPQLCYSGPQPHNSTSDSGYSSRYDSEKDPLSYQDKRQEKCHEPGAKIAPLKASPIKSSTEGFQRRAKSTVSRLLQRRR